MIGSDFEKGGEKVAVLISVIIIAIVYALYKKLFSFVLLELLLGLLAISVIGFIVFKLFYSIYTQNFSQAWIFGFILTMLLAFSFIVIGIIQKLQIIPQIANCKVPFSLIGYSIGMIGMVMFTGMVISDRGDMNDFLSILLFIIFFASLLIFNIYREITRIIK